MTHPHTNVDNIHMYFCMKILFEIEKATNIDVSALTCTDKVSIHSNADIMYVKNKLA